MKNTGRYHLLLPILFVSLWSATLTIAQNAVAIEESRSFKTYPFDDPDPNPILVSNPKIYPYHRFDGYSHKSEKKEWKVVKLENDLIEVYVLPEVGGKVWGAIEKSSGEEFIYRNEVMKFRNISMRGPWTSGGIEFNFGIIGHHPSTATPVDYVIEDHPDGSVSCTVGSIDLPSRTQWRVQILLQPDKASFETKALWYNPTPVMHSYYNWMTAAAPALSDFEFYTPGDQYLKHSGEAMSWPIDEDGRNLALYHHNNFGPSKSYHVVGEFNDFFGGYYNDSGYGFGHWSEYEEMPGQKLWLWALSRAGGIWEELLTDKDGQYIEFQAGRLFVQYSPGSHKNPITQAAFEPHMTDQWTETWFPVLGIGGLTDVSDKAVMKVERKDGQLEIAINAFQAFRGPLKVISGDEIVIEEALELEPMEVYSQSFAWDNKAEFRIDVPDLNLRYNSDNRADQLKRPFDNDWNDLPPESAESFYLSGMEALKFREYDRAEELFTRCNALDSYHLRSLVGLADLAYRSARYNDGLSWVDQALKIDTYDPSANYMAGILYRADNDLSNALESFGWAARSATYRSAAYAQMAELWFIKGEWEKTQRYIEKSRTFNQKNVVAMRLQATLSRMHGDTTEAELAIQELLDLDPLSHYAYFERLRLRGKEEDKGRFLNMHRSEFPVQTYLELAICYYNLNQNKEALAVLELAPQHPLIDLWWTYLKDDYEVQYFEEIPDLPPDLVFPYRRETLAVLEWAAEHSEDWTIKYYLALNLWGLGREQEALGLMMECGAEPDHAPFYVSRASLMADLENKDPLNDLAKAQELRPEDYRNWRSLIQYYFEKKDYSKALNIANQAHIEFPDHYAISMDLARVLVSTKAYKEAVKILEEVRVLPFEGASEGHRLYEQAHLGQAFLAIENLQMKQAIDHLEDSKQWPENLGVGKPYDPDERMSDYLLAYAHQKLGDSDKVDHYLNQVQMRSEKLVNSNSKLHLLGVRAIQYLKDSFSASQFINKLYELHQNDPQQMEWIMATYNRSSVDQSAAADYNGTVMDRFMDLIVGLKI